jgi:hypothetical protein
VVPLALVASTIGVPAAAKPILFPPKPNGVAEWRDERDVAPFLAAWKAEGLRRARHTAVSATPNQLKYDVNWYDLDLTFNPAGAQVSGTVRVRAKVLTGPISTLDLDLNASLGVTAVTSAGIPTSFSRPGDLVTVNLDRAYATGEFVDVRVTYTGSPVTGSFGYLIANGRQLIWSLSEPYGARTWWPCKDQPADKADSVTIRYTVPSGLTTASNGTQLSATDNGIQAVTRWRESHPIATYLVSIASYPYTHTVDWYRPSPTDSMRIDFFNYPETAGGAAAVQAKVKTMLGAYATRFGPYPFQDEKYGHAQFNFSGGMEHQTCTSLGAFVEFVVAHELGHQWWGDLVTCRDFHHIWLNEGFATYMEAIWAESQGGLAAYHSDLALNKYYGPGTVYVANDQDEARIFDSNLSYDKGSWVLHMLRHVLGDATFFASMLQYRATNGYGTATTETFRAACETVSGRDLTKFFQQWVYGERYPVYRATWDSHAAGAPGEAGSGYDVTLTLEQRQGWQLFTMPVDVRVTTTGGPRDFVVPDSLASQAFTLHVDAQPTALELDADDWILKQVERPVVQPPFDRGVLVVNGVDWATFGVEITSAYTDHAFSGNYIIDFWDHFNAPPGGYPVGVPAPLGHGRVPPEVLGHYRNVVWVGNDVNGDGDSWVQTPIRPYLDAGGNVLLFCKDAQAFLDDGLLAYLGITFTNENVTINDCIATRPGFSNLTRTGTQSTNAVFDTVRTQPDTQLLYKTTSGFTPQRGVGVVRLRAGGAGLRANGGRLAFLSGRPYRWTHTLLNATSTTILSQYFLEPLNGLGVPPTAHLLSLAPLTPNPGHGERRLGFTLPVAGDARLELLDVTGRHIRTLAAGVLPAGPHERTWDGRDERGNLAPAGLYFVRLRAGRESLTERFVQLP